MTNSKNIFLKIIVELARILLAITFIFSGFVKSIDPLGTVYKIQDYFLAFGLPNLHTLSLVLSVFLCVAELCLGLFMLLGLYRKWTSRALFVVMLFMTPLTLYLAVANPVKDCGCFGDALIITNWQTFFKNIALLVCSILTLVYHNKITNLFTGKFYWFVALYIIIWGISFCLYNYYNEPIIDFRPYRIGNNIPSLMTVDKDKAPVYENVMIYEKDGVKKDFTETNYPWQDTTWVFVDRQSKLVKDGEEPTISDFSINRLYLSPDRSEIEDTEDITTEILSDSSYTFLMISYSLNDMQETNLSHFEDINNYAKENGYKFYCLTASPQDSILKLEKENITNFEFCTADERVLKTMVRSNPGLILLKDGVVINKWSDNNVPNENLLNDKIEKLSISKITDEKSEENQKLLYIAIMLFAPLFLIKIFDVCFFHKKPRKNTLNDQKTNL